MTAVAPFLFEGEHLVRTVERDGEPWFVAADVCRTLELGNAREALAKLDENEVSTVSLTDGAQGGPPRNIINESGLYTLILRCRDATTPGTVAHRFRKWVTAEVLPSIRRTGGYAAEAPPLPPAIGAKPFPAWPLDELRTKRNVVEMCRMLHGLDGARWMAAQLGFPAPPENVVPTRPERQRPPVEAWWHGRLMAGTTRGAADRWERLVGIELLFQDYRVTIADDGPADKTAKAAWAMRLNRLVPGMTVERLRVTVDWRARHYRLPSLADCRTLYCAVTGEAAHWPEIATAEA